MLEQDGDIDLAVRDLYWLHALSFQRTDYSSYQDAPVISRFSKVSAESDIATWLYLGKDTDLESILRFFCDSKRVECD